MTEYVQDQGRWNDAVFERFYQREIAPHIDALEKARRQRLATLRRSIAFAVPLLAIAGGVFFVFGFFQTHLVWCVSALVVGAVLCAIWIGRPARQHREALKKQLVAPVCSFLGNLIYDRKADDAFDLRQFRDNGVVGSYNRSSLEDFFTGTYRDTEFRMVEAKLRRKGGRRSSSRTVFKGLLLDIGVPVPFSCRILLTSDKGNMVNRIEGFFRGKFGGRESVSFDNPAFEDRYQVYSDEPDAARTLIAPPLLDSLVALSEAADRKALTAAFAEGRFLLALPHRRNLFEIGKLNRSLEHLEEDVGRLLREITIVHRIIDYLHGDRPDLML